MSTGVRSPEATNVTDRGMSRPTVHVGARARPSTTDEDKEGDNKAMVKPGHPLRAIRPNDAPVTSVSVLAERHRLLQNAAD